MGEWVAAAWEGGRETEGKLTGRERQNEEDRDTGKNWAAKTRKQNYRNRRREREGDPRPEADRRTSIFSQISLGALLLFATKMFAL